MDDLIPILFIVGVFVLIGIGFIYSKIAAKKRRTNMLATAEELGLTFCPDGNDQLLSRLGGFKLFNQGRSRKMKNLIQGDSGEVKIAIFDYHYTTGHGKHSTTHVQSIVSLQSSDLKCPDFTMRLEGMFDKIGNALGLQNIDFDSHPKFSRTFVLQGSDEGAIRNYFSPSLLEFFEQKSGISVEAIADTMFFYRPRKRIRPGEIKDQLSQAYEIFGAMVDRS